MIKDKDEFLVNLGIETIRLRAFQKATAEVLYANDLISKEDFESKVNSIFSDIKKEELKHLLKMTEEEFESMENNSVDNE